MKTDAAVLLGLIEEMAASLPPSDAATYNVLSQFDGRTGEDFSTISVVKDSCGRLRKFVDLIPNTTQVQRAAFILAIKNFESNFSLKSMGTSWKQFLANVKTESHIQTLNFLDYMIQSQDTWKIREIDVEDAQDLLAELNEMIKQLSIPDYLKGVLYGDIFKLQLILKNYERFGEQDYWEKFQKLTGLFGSIHTTLDSEAQSQAQPLVAKLIGKVTGSLSVTADVAQLAQVAPTIFGLLPKI